MILRAVHIIFLHFCHPKARYYPLLSLFFQIKTNLEIKPVKYILCPILIDFLMEAFSTILKKQWDYGNNK